MHDILRRQNISGSRRSHRRPGIRIGLDEKGRFLTNKLRIDLIFHAMQKALPWGGFNVAFLAVSWVKIFHLFCMHGGLLRLSFQAFSSQATIWKEEQHC